ncbi:MAG TPA: PEP-CTERM sorting domain-containing protein [Methylophilaceae bacterium]|nr:PEP-CTERM sorting domain-containing protein [Methylophilaceae bacterium]
MKTLTASALLLFTSFFTGLAQAENVYDMKYQGYLIKQEAGPGSSTFFDPIPIAEISNEHLTFSGNAVLWFDENPDFAGLSPSTCCSVSLGNQGSFTVRFDQPVNSVGLNILPVAPTWDSFIESLGSSTVSAVYKNSFGEIVGQSSVTTNWLGEFWSDQFQWNNTFNGHEGAFGVSSVDGFSEITFSVEGMEGSFNAKGFSYIAPLFIASTNLYYSYANPVPEPQTYAMMLAGLGMLGFTAKRHKKLHMRA